MNGLSGTDEAAAAGYLKALAAWVETEPDADGIATVTLGAVTVHLARPEGMPGRVVARAEIGPIDDLQMPENFLEDLLTAAFFGRGTQLATPSVDEGVAYLTVTCRTERLGTRVALETFVRRFARVVREWRTRLSLCGKADSADAAAGAAAGNAVHAFERIYV